MRLHQLRATAFGPFAGTVEIDFDALSASGLFLLSGPTGAGKTSVLDAVCFALYGDVPGDRNAAKRLRSDLAAPGVRPVVALEATLSGRRFRITRSPAWERPKKRGEGVTTEQASVLVEERVQGAWVAQSTRLDESGHLVSGLLGMNVGQFTQVAMLPQGRFQAFLRARSDERHRLLQQLFRTGRFEDVEKWLRERRLELKRRSDASREVLADLVSRVSETTGSAAPEDDLQVPAWAHGLRHAAEETAASVAELVTAAEAEEAAARVALDEDRALAARQARIRAARAEEQGLTEAAAEHDAMRERLDAARRAAPVVPLHQVAVRADRTRSTAAEAVDRLEIRDPGVWHQAARDAVDGLARARALEPRVRRLEVVRADAERLVVRRSALAADRDRALAAAESRVASLEQQVAEARLAHAAARTGALDARAQALDVREHRLIGMAAEMAGSLAVGASCPVCGSCDHPHKATPASGTPDEAAEKAAQKASDDAAATEHLRDVELHTAVQELESARARVGIVPGEIAAEIATVAASLAAARDEQDALDQELAGHDADLVPALTAQEKAARAALEALDALTRAEVAVGEADAAVDVALAEAGFGDVSEALAAAMDRTAYDRVSAQLADHDRRAAAVAATLAEAGTAEVESLAAPDLGVRSTAHAATLERLRDAHARQRTWAERARRLAELTAGLDAALATWMPLRDELETATRLSGLVEGKSADNRLQMRLSAYVLAYRLAQVVAAANERLDRMSDRRYALEHTGRRGAGETRGGLSLVIRDDWSGEARDPATLSGGETFVVSLALALGLADVVTREAGGAELDTLFVDEGFGALDADTLDDVMDTLDALREGGRVVGVVSHVAEMRDRIPTQLVVSKSRTGSTVAVRR